MSAEQLKHLALVAHHCYGSYDLAAICIQHLLNRDAIVAHAGSRYFELAAAHRSGAKAG